MSMLLMAALAFGGADGPEISTSKGKTGEVVVLYPRVTPATDDADVLALAKTVQDRLASRVATMGQVANTRPAPERVCPRSTGCKVESVGAVLVHNGGGCAVVATVTDAGQQAHTVVPWAGKLELSADSVAFREPPEALITVHDFAPCAELEAELAKQDAAVDAALKGVL
jgi:hypothetical protein